jgi:hypothetical protein
MTRAISIIAITSAGLFLSSIGAHAGTWCANYGTGPGMNCGFYSFQQLPGHDFRQRRALPTEFCRLGLRLRGSAAAAL